MTFADRKSTYPNRYLMTDASGNTSYVTLERADEPVAVGTPLNAETFNDMQAEVQIEDEDYPGCFYRLIDGVKYWINPPLIPNTYYLTTKCYNGVPVKQCAVEVELASSDNIKIPVSTFFPSGTILHMSGAVFSEATDDQFPVPFYTNTQYHCAPEIYQRVLYTNHSSLLVGYTLRLIIEFV